MRFSVSRRVMESIVSGILPGAASARRGVVANIPLASATIINRRTGADEDRRRIERVASASIPARLRMNNRLWSIFTISNREDSAHSRHKSIIMATERVLETRLPAYDNYSIDITVTMRVFPMTSDRQPDTERQADFYEAEPPQASRELAKLRTSSDYVAPFEIIRRRVIDDMYEVKMTVDATMIIRLGAGAGIRGCRAA